MHVTGDFGDVPVESLKFLEVVNETEPQISHYITWHTFGRFWRNTAILIVQNLSMQIAS